MIRSIFVWLRGHGVRDMPEKCLLYVYPELILNSGKIVSTGSERERERGVKRGDCLWNPRLQISSGLDGLGDCWSLWSIDRDYSGILYVNHCLLIVELVQGCEVKFWAFSAIVIGLQINYGPFPNLTFPRRMYNVHVYAHDMWWLHWEDVIVHCSSTGFVLRTHIEQKHNIEMQ